MSFIHAVSKIRIYDNFGGTVAEPIRAITYSTQDIGSGENAGRLGPLVTKAVLPGTDVDGTYTPTDITALPTEIQGYANAAWGTGSDLNDTYTAHATHLGLTYTP